MDDFKKIEFVVLDVETTGLSPVKGDRVIEVTQGGDIAWQLGGGSLIAVEKPSAIQRLENGKLVQ